MTAWMLWTLAIGVLVISALAGLWMRKRGAELPVTPQQELLRKAQMRGRSEMGPLVMYFATIPVVKTFTSSDWAQIAALTLAGIWLVASQWYYSRHPLDYQPQT